MNGTRLKETAKVNNSLSELRNVIRKLAAKGKPTYRNSMLTKLLRPALSAGGKTLLIVNVSPTEESREETRGSLLFAQMSKEVELGKVEEERRSRVRYGAPSSSRARRPRAAFSPDPLKSQS